MMDQSSESFTPSGAAVPNTAAAHGLVSTIQAVRSPILSIPSVSEGHLNVGVGGMMSLGVASSSPQLPTPQYQQRRVMVKPIVPKQMGGVGGVASLTSSLRVPAPVGGSTAAATAVSSGQYVQPTHTGVAVAVAGLTQQQQQLALLASQVQQTLVANANSPIGSGTSTSSDSVTSLQQQQQQQYHQSPLPPLGPPSAPGPSGSLPSHPPPPPHSSSGLLTPQQAQALLATVKGLSSSLHHQVVGGGGVGVGGGGGMGGGGGCMFDNLSSHHLVHAASSSLQQQPPHIQPKQYIAPRQKITAPVAMLPVSMHSGGAGESSQLDSSSIRETSSSHPYPPPHLPHPHLHSHHHPPHHHHHPVRQQQQTVTMTVEQATPLAPPLAPPPALPRHTPAPSQGPGPITTSRPRKPCHCRNSQCLKLYCDCFANGEFCREGCQCVHCKNNVDNTDERARAVKSCLDRNPNAFKPKVGHNRMGDERRHIKGCNCRRSGCLKNYCECYEAKIPCSAMCRCVGCKNVQEKPENKSLMQLADAADLRTQQQKAATSHFIEQLEQTGTSKPFPATRDGQRLPFSFINKEVAKATCLCMLEEASHVLMSSASPQEVEAAILEEFGKCMHQIITAAGAANKELT